MTVGIEASAIGRPALGVYAFESTRLVRVPLKGLGGGNGGNGGKSLWQQRRQL